MTLSDHAEDITFTFDDRMSGDSKVSALQHSKPSEKGLAKIELLFKKHVKASKKATESMSKSAKSVEETVSNAIDATSKRPSQFVAATGLTLGILTLFSIGIFWAVDSRLKAHEDTLKRRLIAYEGIMSAVAGNLEGLRRESLNQISVFSDEVNTMNGRIGDVHDALLLNTSDKDGPLDAAAQPGG